MSTEKDLFATLSPEDIKKIKENLILERVEILKEVNDITDGADNVKFPEFGDKLDENAQEIDEYTTNLATDKVLESSLRDIDKALERIENKTYGVCKYCHKPINPKRLLARPVASACVECKTKLQNQ
ncbi:TraR/DksA family transcriptional regulator [Candidatus Parcubacteria bacterium]|nr:TraR/DksA family transcriptional regulator [Patescibacteria group bacterium]MBU4309707.1 TraR/DksA family transcriptional regulator [Patescibacteria group bacterium]MBU4431669.1 TraR/DksA family transcriptional regulator [Patescibacteria group bacterium]MBU4577905.1 TraR/DksA family transcriptional regulator [Patescibacteria group bacterium]MCG2696585.1 TraR/DksA family transcriptional regulator [Candidatus Parcubacteria bacterium]